MNTNQNPGLNCPKCTFKISVSIEQLLSHSPLVCPACGLVLQLDSSKSKPAIDALSTYNKKLQTAK